MHYQMRQVPPAPSLVRIIRIGDGPLSFRRQFHGSECAHIAHRSHPQHWRRGLYAKHIGLHAVVKWDYTYWGPHAMRLVERNSRSAAGAICRSCARLTDIPYFLPVTLFTRTCRGLEIVVGSSLVYETWTYRHAPIGIIFRRKSSSIQSAQICT